jgi:hypothetical protein
MLKPHAHAIAVKHIATPVPSRPPSLHPAKSSPLLPPSLFAFQEFLSAFNNFQHGRIEIVDRAISQTV